MAGKGTEQDRVKAKIDGFLTKYTNTLQFGWTPELDGPKAKEAPKESFMEFARMPLWCPKCKHVMNKKLDNKMYWLHNMCFDCVIEMETQLRIAGKYEEYEKNKVKENIRSFIRDCEQQVKEEKIRLEEGTTNVDVVNEQLASIQYETWKLGQGDVNHYKERMDNVLKQMYEDFEKSFGEKYHATVDSNVIQ